MTDIASPETLLAQVADKLANLLEERAISQPLMVGIHTGGEWIAQKLHSRLDIAEPLASLDISFYRDDFSRIGVNPSVKPSQLPPNVEDRHIILVDDVMHTGRTVRAAMNELFDYGRPASIILVCLVERDGRELPIRADISAVQLSLEADQHIKLTGPEPLAFEFK